MVDAVLADYDPQITPLCQLTARGLTAGTWGGVSFWSLNHTDECEPRAHTLCTIYHSANRSFLQIKITTLDTMTPDADGRWPTDRRGWESQQKLN
jgi:hypothetical protein